METTNKHKEHKQMKTEFKLLIDEIKEQDRKVNQLQRDLGGKEHRIKLLESVTDTDNDIIEDLNKRIKGLESLLSKYGRVNVANKGNCKYTFKPYRHIVNSIEYREKLIKQGCFSDEGKIYDVVRTSKKSRAVVISDKNRELVSDK